VTGMIRTLAITNDMKIEYPLSLERLSEQDINWFWVDFESPTEKEISYLSSYFHFHPLSIEDCIQLLHRPKLDYYEGYDFFVFNALNQNTLDPEEVVLFVGKNYIVSFHINKSSEINESWQRIKNNENMLVKGPTYVAYLILDKIVDKFFPAIYKIEDLVNDLDRNIEGKFLGRLVDEIFDIRGDLLKLRRTINAMRDLLYRILNSERLNWFKEHRLYFSDIYDHLLKLSEMIESNREITSDMRDSYLSISSSRMNTNMMVLTVISTIFIPLTFVAGVYGMNFQNMPELKWRYGYFIIMGLMIIIGTTMLLWFKRKGWFDINR
jgi:magnesium transporter